MSDLIRLMREWLDVLAMGPAEVFAGRVAEGVVLRLPFAPPGVEAEHRSAAEAIAAMEPVWAGKIRFDWHEVEIRRTEDPELLVTTARSDVLLKSGRPYANSYVMLTRFRDGRVVEHVEYFNPLAVLAAFGPETGGD
jgi:ketosteroid isomerase-like protein